VTGTTFDSKSIAFDNAARDRRQTRVVKVVATATDTCGNKVTAEGEITVTLNPQARRLDDIIFPAGSSRVNNCAKRLLLEELTPLLRDTPNSRVVLIGHRDERNDGTPNAQLDRARVLNTAAVLSAGTGICPQLDLSRVSGAWVGTDQATPPRASVCGTSTNIRERRGQAVGQNDTRAMFRRVEIWFVPEGAELPANLQSATPVPAASVKPLGCPK
jgi:outer membrane protein OmpA-like peptidoglycan-associated protein